MIYAQVLWLYLAGWIQHFFDRHPVAIVGFQSNAALDVDRI